MADEAYEFQIHLSSGQTVVADVRAADLDHIAASNPGFVAPDVARDDALHAASTLLYSILLNRVDTRAGETEVRDREGRNWMIPASSIVAFSYRAPDGPTRRDLDIVRPKPVRGAYSAS